MEGSSEPANWNASADGMGQLRELNSMERSQDSSYWISSAILIVASSVLVAEFFRQEDHYLARLAISIVGLVIAVVTMLMVTRAVSYKKRWIYKAKALEKELGIPSSYSVWDERGLPGFAASLALMLAMYGFVVMWAFYAAFAAWNLVL